MKPLHLSCIGGHTLDKKSTLTAYVDDNDTIILIISPNNQAKILTYTSEKQRDKDFKRIMKALLND